MEACYGVPFPLVLDALTLADDRDASSVTSFEDLSDGSVGPDSQPAKARRFSGSYTPSHPHIEGARLAASSWTAADSAALYNTGGWGAGYFSVSEGGRLQVAPRGGECRRRRRRRGLGLGALLAASASVLPSRPTPGPSHAPHRRGWPAA